MLAHSVGTAGHDDAQDGSWLTLSEAAERSGLHKEALRAKAKRGQLQARKNNRNETLVMLPPDMLRAAQGGAQGAAQAQVDQLVELVRSLEDELTGARASAAAEMSELRIELARTQARLGAAEDVARAGIEAARREAEAQIAAHEVINIELRRSLEREQARADRLEAEARRPWWRRLIG